MEEGEFLNSRKGPRMVEQVHARKMLQPLPRADNREVLPQGKLGTEAILRFAGRLWLRSW